MCSIKLGYFTYKRSEMAVYPIKPLSSLPPHLMSSYDAGLICE